VDIFDISLRAVDPTRRCWRAYSISCHEDLFGVVVVEVRWGRIGAKQRISTTAFDDQDAARRRVRELLTRRRRKSKRRPPYSATDVYGADWLGAGDFFTNTLDKSTPPVTVGAIASLDSVGTC
jgi:predicted DNA-binding WGR domain protein